MSGVLLLVTRTLGVIPADLRGAVFPSAGVVVFLQNGVYNTKEIMDKNGIRLSAGMECYTLGEDADARNVVSSFARIDYPWLVDAIEACEKTITL
jgi:sulfur transfer complex TusBCD TusB component (DsrH family)